MAVLIDEPLRFALERDSANVVDIDIFLIEDPAPLGLGVSSDIVASDAVATMKDAAARSQSALMDALRSATATAQASDALSEDVQILGQFWATNSVAARVTPSVLRRLLERDDILAIQSAAYADVEDLFDEASEPIAVPEATQIPWNVQKTNAPALWSTGITGQGVIVAVIDTGVNYRHPDLAGRMWASNDPSVPLHGYDFAGKDPDPIDQNGHGTKCAGIVAGDGTSGVVTGVAPRASIMALRVGIDQRDSWAAMQFAMAHKADVVSMSLTWRLILNPSQLGWRRMCEALLAAGVAHANSSGNDGNDLSTFPLPNNIGAPGNCPPPVLHPHMPIHGGVSSAVSCGATDSADRLAPNSGRGPVVWATNPYSDYPYSSGSSAGLIKPDLCAPGPGSTSCNWRFGFDPSAKAYVPFGGTSASTPHVAGCMALLVHAARRSGVVPDPRKIFVALEASAVRVVGQTVPKQNHYGSGRVDVAAAYHFGRTQGWWV